MGMVTIESTYVAADGDMGDTHVAAHAGQDQYRQAGEPKIETLTSNKSSDASLDLAVKKAQEQGLKTEAEWQKYNDGLPKSRRKKSYDEYVAAASANWAKGVQRNVDSAEKMPREKRDAAYQSLSARERNGGIVVYGKLLYVEPSTVYDGLKPDELRERRAAEAETLRNYMTSDDFKTLNPGLLRAEIHYDELGGTHGQDQSVMYHLDAKGRASVSPRLYWKDVLVARYGSEDALNQRLDALSAAHKAAAKGKDREKTTRADALYQSYVDGGKLGTFDSAHPGERNTRIEELWRYEQMRGLQREAEKVFAAHGLSYDTSDTYRSDGQHLKGREYGTQRDADRKANATTAKTKKWVQQQRQAVADYAKETGEKLAANRKAMIAAAKIDAAHIEANAENTARDVRAQIAADRVRLGTDRKALAEAQKQLAHEKQSLGGVKSGLTRRHNSQEKRQAEMDKQAAAMAEEAQALKREQRQLERDRERLRQTTRRAYLEILTARQSMAAEMVALLKVYVQSHIKAWLLDRATNRNLLTQAERNHKADAVASSGAADFADTANKKTETEKPEDFDEIMTDRAAANDGGYEDWLKQHPEKDPLAKLHDEIASLDAKRSADASQAVDTALNPPQTPAERAAAIMAEDLGTKSAVPDPDAIDVPSDAVDALGDLAAGGDADTKAKDAKQQKLTNLRKRTVEEAALTGTKAQRDAAKALRLGHAKLETATTETGAKLNTKTEDGDHTAAKAADKAARDAAAQRRADAKGDDLQK